MVAYAANPHYDEILVFAGIKVPTSQDFYKLIDEERQLYKLVEKPNVRQFKDEIKMRLLAKKKPWWPHTQNLSMAVTVGGPLTYIQLKDLDNYLKTIFDAIKGIVIEDDHQVTNVTVGKEENPFICGFMIAIRINPNKGETIINYGANLENWDEDRRLKIERGGMCCMDGY